jgi:hypothetical protein
MTARTDILAHNFRGHGREQVVLAEMAGIVGAQTAFGPLAQLLQLLAEPVRRHGQRRGGGGAETPAVHEPLPFVVGEKMEQRRIPLLLRRAQEQLGDNGGGRIDVGRQQRRPPDQRIDERAFAGLHLPDQRDAAGVALQLLHHIVDENCERRAHFAFQPYPRLSTEPLTSPNFAATPTSVRLVKPGVCSCIFMNPVKFWIQAMDRVHHTNSDHS